MKTKYEGIYHYMEPRERILTVIWKDGKAETTRTYCVTKKRSKGQAMELAKRFAEKNGVAIPRRKNAASVRRTSYKLRKIAAQQNQKPIDLVTVKQFVYQNKQKEVYAAKDGFFTALSKRIFGFFSGSEGLIKTAES